MCWEERQGLVVSKRIWNLFRIFSTWGPGLESERRGLTLELNAHSPSNWKHWFKTFYFTAHNKNNEETVHNCSGIDDPKHGWIDGNQITHPRYYTGAVERLFGTVPLRFKNDLPRVNIVTSFVVRRQLRRWLKKDSLMLLPDKLPGLNHVVYEPWRQLHRYWRVINDKAIIHLVKGQFPRSVKRLSVFEDFSECLIKIVQTELLSVWTPSQYEVEIPRFADAQIAAAFAARSVDLEQLSVAYMANAEDFFNHANPNPSWTWQHLNSLALTSTFLSDTPENGQVIDDLLYLAGITARRMPKLRDFALWYGLKGETCAFIYQSDGYRASITWRGTWDLQLSSRVVKVWECMAIESHLCEAFQVGKKLVDGVIWSHGDAIHYLDLPCPVVDPTSLWQIRREGMNQGVI